MGWALSLPVLVPHFWCQGVMFTPGHRACQTCESQCCFPAPLTCFMPFLSLSPKGRKNVKGHQGRTSTQLPKEWPPYLPFRLHNIKKAYKKRDKKTEALRGMRAVGLIPVKDKETPLCSQSTKKSTCTAWKFMSNINWCDWSLFCSVFTDFSF